MSLHPAWPEVAELDQIIAHVSGLSRPASPASVSIADIPLTGSTRIPIAAPAAAAPPIAGAQRSADNRIARLAASLEDHSQRVLRRDVAALEKRLEADVAVERARLKEEGVPELIARNPEDERELRKRRLEAIALESEVRVAFEPALSAAKKRLAAVVARIKELQAPPEIREEVRNEQIAKQIDQYRTTRRAELEKLLAERSERVESSARASLDAYRAGLRQRLAEAEPPASMHAPAAAPVPDPALPSPSRLARSLGSGPVAGLLRAPEQIAALKEQRARLVRVITDDLERRIQGLARQNNWTLVGPGLGADLTPAAVDLIKRQFQSATQPQ